MDGLPCKCSNSSSVNAFLFADPLETNFSPWDYGFSNNRGSERGHELVYSPNGRAQERDGTRKSGNP